MPSISVILAATCGRVVRAVQGVRRRRLIQYSSAGCPSCLAGCSRATLLAPTHPHHHPPLPPTSQKPCRRTPTESWTLASPAGGVGGVGTPRGLVPAVRVAAAASAQQWGTRARAHLHLFRGAELHGSRHLKGKGTLHAGSQHLRPQLCGACVPPREVHEAGTHNDPRSGLTWPSNAQRAPPSAPVPSSTVFKLMPSENTRVVVFPRGSPPRLLLCGPLWPRQRVEWAADRAEPSSSRARPPSVACLEIILLQSLMSHASPIACLLHRCRLV